MKKVLTILLLLLVVLIPVFADIEVSGLASGGATLIKGSNLKGDDLQASNMLSSYIEASGADDSGKIGGDVQINAQASATDSNTWAWTALAWWNPVVQFKLQIGTIDDFALTDIVGWGYHANDAEDFVASPRISYVGDYFSDTTGFFAGTGTGWNGVGITINPFYGLSLNVALPFGIGTEQRDADGIVIQKYKATQVYDYTLASLTYTLYGLGRFAVSFEGGGDGKLYLANGNADDPNNSSDIPYDPTTSFTLDQLNANASTLYASFLLTAFEDKKFTMNIGFDYTLPVSTTDDLGRKLTYYSPMEAALGIAVGSDRNGFKARLASTFMGRAERTGSDALHEPFMVGFGILPYVTWGPFKFYLNMGIAYRLAEEYMDDSGKVQNVGNSTALGWHVNPYLMLSIGTGRFFFGFQLESDGLKYELSPDLQQAQNVISHDVDGNAYYAGKPIINWGIPVGIMFDF